MPDLGSLASTCRTTFCRQRGRVLPGPARAGCRGGRHEHGNRKRDAPTGLSGIYYIIVVTDGTNRSRRRARPETTGSGDHDRVGGRGDEGGRDAAHNVRRRVDGRGIYDAPPSPRR